MTRSRTPPTTSSTTQQPSTKCGHCGFDDALYGLRADAISSLRIVPNVLPSAVEDMPLAALDRRPDAGTWSIAEYSDHLLEVYAAHRTALEDASDNPLAPINWPEIKTLTAVPRSSSEHFAATMEAMSEQAAALQLLAAAASDQQWDRDFGRHVRNVVHEGFHHLADVGDIRSGLGYGPDVATGRITKLSISAGGVPKRPVDQVLITPAGVDGDSQNDRKHHGRPCQAVCLYSEDVMAALRTEGHTIEAGFAGENVTVEGIEWASLRPGSRVTIGSVPMLISAHAIPCAKNADWFVDRYFGRMLHANHPGWSRLYAIPLGSGQLREGDPVTVTG